MGQDIDSRLSKCIESLQTLRSQLAEGLVTDEEAARGAVDAVYQEMIVFLQSEAPSAPEE